MTEHDQYDFGLVQDHVYVRRELLERFGGQRQSGITTPARYPVIFVFTGATGKEHGYGFDGWKSKDTFHYTGEGQQGDMTFVRGNKAIRDHEKNGKRIFLFEQLPNRGETRGKVRFLDEMRCTGYRKERRDSSGVARDVIIFELTRVGR